MDIQHVGMVVCVLLWGGEGHERDGPRQVGPRYFSTAMLGLEGIETRPRFDHSAITLKLARDVGVHAFCVDGAATRCPCSAVTHH